MISIDTGAAAGQSGLVRIEYLTGDSCCSAEQGWFIDDANLLGCG